MTGDKQPTQKPQQPVVQQEQSTATAPFRATGANGAPVFAGPPAYRWYGWGSVTPGANPLAPTGQYPKASANWYSITGATPGAFPVPVSNPGRVQPGTEPPSYGLSRSQPSAQPVVPVSVQAQTQPHHHSPKRGRNPMTGRSTRRVGRSSCPHPCAGLRATTKLPAQVNVPTIPTPPVTKPAAVAPPVIPPPDDVPAPIVSAPSGSVPPTVPKPESVATDPPLVAPVPVVPAVPVVAPAKPILPAPTAEPVHVPLPTTERKPLEAAPAPLPSSVTENPPREELHWQPNTEPSPPPPGSWTPAPGTAPLPTTAPSTPAWQSGSAKVGPVARGQFNDNTPDPIATLIKQVCQGRAEAVEVRWTGAKKMSVCFEIRTAAAAQKLVSDISKRPELSAYQIDFCVLVK